MKLVTHRLPFFLLPSSLALFLTRDIFDIAFLEHSHTDTWLSQDEHGVLANFFLLFSIPVPSSWLSGLGKRFTDVFFRKQDPHLVIIYIPFTLFPSQEYLSQIHLLFDCHHPNVGPLTSHLCCFRSPPVAPFLSSTLPISTTLYFLTLTLSRAPH